jgi:hypothetical protein
MGALVTAVITSTFLRVECDRKHCASVIAHLSLDEDDEVAMADVLELWPPVPKPNASDPDRWLCAECLAGAKSGRTQVTWRRP